MGRVILDRSSKVLQENIRDMSNPTITSPNICKESLFIQRHHKCVFVKWSHAAIALLWLLSIQVVPKIVTPFVHSVWSPMGPMSQTKCGLVSRTAGLVQGTLTTDDKQPPHQRSGDHCCRADYNVDGKWSSGKT